MKGALATPDPMLDQADQHCLTALTLFDLNSFQSLSKDQLLVAQRVAGHGEEWGLWTTPESLDPNRVAQHYRSIDIAKRLRSFLPDLPGPASSIDTLIDEGVLLLTRLALLMRLAPSSGQRSSKNRRLKPRSITNKLYSHCPKIVSLAIQRKAECEGGPGLLSWLTADDVEHLGIDKYTRIELERLTTLAARGWWSDVHPQPNIAEITDPKGSKRPNAPEPIVGEYQPIPDDYLAEFGPRVLWLINELGPNLLPLLEALALRLDSLDWSSMTRGKLHDDYGVITKFISEHLREHPWTDRSGKPLEPPFPLMTGARNADRYEWPPRNYEHLKVLSASLQSAQLFITLLACAGRVGEVLTLSRSCVATSRTGKNILLGWTYKLSGNLFGDLRQWPAPLVLVQALGQQSRLAAIWSLLPKGELKAGLQDPTTPSQLLWLSLGVGSGADASSALGTCTGALQSLAVRVGMDPKPGGINLHPHRLRKTIGRLAGVALFNSPLVLKRLFGHKFLEMTLHYILSQEDVRTEAEAVLRELRIMHCAETLQELRDAMATESQTEALGGPPVPRLVEAIREHERRLAKSGRLWTEGTAYELAYLLTANGQGWRFIQRNVLCTKIPGEDGLCRKKRRRGDPDTSNCKAECSNRMVLALEQRDAEEVVESYLDIARKARDDEQYMVFYEAMQRFIEELDTHPDIKDRYLADLEVKALLEEYESLPK